MSMLFIHSVPELMSVFKFNPISYRVYSAFIKLQQLFITDPHRSLFPPKLKTNNVGHPLVCSN